ncbi:MAG: LarC family nickel insertion protein, partial [Thermoplasmata archaeon]|nr:LarC family nickel insertion protein [Thermoplasmata archaeon]
LLKGKPIEFTDIDAEITTPTGAALLRMAEFCYPEIEVDRVGYGLGKKKLDIPNLLRIVIGREVDAGGVYIIETNIDDMNPELYPHVISNLIDAGALDAFIIPVVMKKNRGGVLLKVIATGNKLEEIKKIIYEETTTFGCRYYKVVRDKLEREIVEVETEYGKIRVKVGYFNGKIITISPEYEDCAKVAKESRVPIREVYEKAREKARKIIS